MELKLKKRELDLTLYEGKKVKVKFPTLAEHQEYLKEIIKHGEEKEYELTAKFLKNLGMDKKDFSEIEKADVYDIIMILTGQKKV